MWTHTDTLKKLLFIRFSSIGDIVLTTPVVRCVSSQLQGVEVHYLTKPSFAGILKSNPYIHKVHELHEDVNQMLNQLKAEQFDFVVDLHHNIRSSRFRLGLGVPSAAFPKLNIQKWLLVNLKWNRMPDMHIVDRYFKTVESLGVRYDGAGLDYFIPETDRVDFRVLPETHRSGYVAMVIGAQHATKRMPASRLNELAAKLKLPVVLLGGKDDHQSGEEIAKGNESNVINLCGKYNLNQSASLVHDAKVVIAHDTGLMHIAAAFRKKIISLWGNTVPDFGMTPLLPSGIGASHIFEVEGLACRPCSKIGYDKCPKGHFKCMTEIDLDAVVRKAHDLFFDH
ncbi:MAG: glycosyltransferase family 9 protein [Bacteroidota bacterium]